MVMAFKSEKLMFSGFCPGDPKSCLNGFRTTEAKTHQFSRGYQFLNFFSQFDFLNVLSRKQLSLLGVFFNSIQEFGMGMAQNQRSLTQCKIEVFIPIHIIDPTAFS